MDAIARRSRWLRVLATLVAAVLALAPAVELLAVLRQAGLADAARQAVFRLPLFCYLVALWMVRGAFGQLARGALFDRVVPAVLARVGWALAAGAAADVVLTPLLLRLVWGTRYGALAHFDPAAITLGMVGLMLAVIARLLTQAAAMRAELDEFL